VRALVLTRMEPDAHGARAEVTIEPLAVQQPQQDLLGAAA